jgi:hypothetical protein
LFQVDIDFRSSCGLRDIVCELVTANMTPSPLNPLAIDRSSIETLPARDRMLGAAALAATLREIYVAGGQCSSLVLSDLLWAVSTHYNALPPAMQIFDEREDKSRSPVQSQS